MTNPQKMIGVPSVVPAGGYELAFSVSLNSAAVVLDDGLVAYSTLTAALRYDPFVYLAAVLDGIKTHLFAAIAAAGGTNLGTADDIDLVGDFTPDDDPNSTRFYLKLTSLNCTFGGNPPDIDSVTIDNASGWASPLGLCQEDDSDTTAAVAGVVTITGLWQPSSLFLFPWSDQDSRDRKVRANVQSIPHRDGDVSLYVSGGFIVRRDYKLVDLNVDFGRPRFPIGRFSAFADSNKRIQFLVAPDVFDTLPDIYFESALVEAGDYVGIDGLDWPVRVKSVDAVGATIDLWESFPASFSPSAGTEVYVMSEAAALSDLHLMRRGLLLYETKESDYTLRPARVSYYAPWGEGEMEEGYDRKSHDTFLWSWEWPLIKRLKSNLTNVT